MNNYPPPTIPKPENINRVLPPSPNSTRQELPKSIAATQSKEKNKHKQTWMNEQKQT